MMRLRHIFITILLLILSIAVSAQPRLRTPEMYVGAHAGAIASTMLFKPNIANIDIMQSPLTINGGLVFRYAGHKVCAIQTELNYMQRGWRETITLGQTTMDYTRQLDYIEIPLLMHLYFGKERFRGFFNLGPQIGYCIRDVATPLPEGVTAPHYLPIDKPFDWGLAGGLGCYYRTRHIGLFQLEARFNFSMGTTYNNRKVDYFSQSNAMNLSLNFAYLWEIKIK
ncbi:MAG: PorT family protein [Paludibacteraceae bacterium]|nr:PorT family protein [Paludibacteraceae bacterium]